MSSETRRPCIKCKGEKIQAILEVTRVLDGSKRESFCFRCVSCDNTGDRFVTNLEAAKRAWDSSNTPPYGNIIVEDALDSLTE